MRPTMPSAKCTFKSFYTVLYFSIAPSASDVIHSSLPLLLGTEQPIIMHEVMHSVLDMWVCGCAQVHVEKRG